MDKRLKHPRVLIIIPAYNEGERLLQVVESIRQCCSKQEEPWDYLVVNDGSDDDTESLCARHGICAVHLPINLGIGGAVQTGYRYAWKNHYDIAVQMDGDGQHDARFLKELLEPLLSQDADIVIGSRFISKEGFQSSLLRRAGIRFLSLLIRLCTGIRVYDVTSGFRAVNREFIRIYAEHYPTDYPEPEAIISAVMHRGRIREIPVIMRQRESGASSIRGFRSAYYMVKVSLSILICRITFGIRK